MSSIVQGRNMVLSQLIGDTYYPIGCAETVEFEFENEIILKTDVNSGGFRKKRVRMQDWRGRASGVLKIDSSDGVLSAIYQLQNGLTRATGTYKFTFTADDNSDFELSGSAILSRLGLRGTVGDIGSFDLDIEGSGAFEMDAAEPPASSAGRIESETYTISGGQNYIEHADLQNVTIIEVDLEGLQHDQTSGTPVGRQFKYTSSIGGKGRIEFDSNAVIDGQKVFVIWLY